MKPHVQIILSIGLGLLAVAMAFFNKPESTNQYRIVTAKNQLLAGEPIQASKLTTAEWPVEVPNGTFSDVKQLENRVVRFTIEADEIILESKLAPLDSKGGMASDITQGMRAITVKVNEVIGVAGFTLPGNYVDILVNGKDTDGHAFSRILLHRVKVLAIAQDTSIDSFKPKLVDAVTLELDPFSAEKLDLARNIGSLTLILRNESDETIIKTEDVSLKDICNQSEETCLDSKQTSPAKENNHLSHNMPVIELRGVNE